MRLKDAIESDIRVFLDAGEFAEEHVVSMGSLSATVLSIMDEDSSAEAAATDNEGIFLSTKRFYVREVDLPRRPVIDKAITIDGEAYLIRSISREMGMLVLTLEVHDSGG